MFYAQFKSSLSGLVLLAGVATLASTSVSAGVLYVTDGDAQRLAIVDTDTASLLGTTVTHSGGYPIAVRDTVWIGRYYGAPTAVEYDLAGNPTGNTAAYTDINAVDGAAGGNTNYALGRAFSNNATVYSADADWSNEVSLFSVNNEFRLVGITYDTVNDSLWISGASQVYQFDLTGLLISSFSHASEATDGGALAYDQATDSIWFVRNGSNNIYQYSKTGTLLQTQSIGGLASNNWGAEFAMSVAIPEPGMLTIFGLGLAGLGLARRKRAA